MKLIVGLGNPGNKYKKTRHNVGFMVVEQFLKDFEPVKKTVWKSSEKFKSDIAELVWQPRRGKEEKVLLAKPITYMNNSGLAVSLSSKYLNIHVSDVWVIHDDIDLPLGGIKIRLGGGDGGHRGITSIRESVGTDKFWRFRLGIGHPRQRIRNPHEKFFIKDVENYVVGNFVGGEWGKARELIKRGAKALAMSLEEGLDAAMNRFNTR